MRSRLRDYCSGPPTEFYSGVDRSLSMSSTARNSRRMCANAVRAPSPSPARRPRAFGSVEARRGPYSTGGGRRRRPTSPRCSSFLRHPEPRAHIGILRPGRNWPTGLRPRRRSNLRTDEPSIRTASAPSRLWRRPPSFNRLLTPSHVPRRHCSLHILWRTVPASAGRSVSFHIRLRATACARGAEPGDSSVRRRPNVMQR